MTGDVAGCRGLGLARLDKDPSVARKLLCL